jgi:hypothetical protein
MNINKIQKIEQSDPGDSGQNMDPAKQRLQDIMAINVQHGTSPLLTHYFISIFSNS